MWQNYPPITPKSHTHLQAMKQKPKYFQNGSCISVGGAYKVPSVKGGEGEATGLRNYKKLNRRRK